MDYTVLLAKTSHDYRVFKTVWLELSVLYLTVVHRPLYYALQSNTGLPTSSQH